MKQEAKIGEWYGKKGPEEIVKIYRTKFKNELEWYESEMWRKEIEYRCADYLALSRAIVEKYGDEGLELVRKVVNEKGRKIGETLAKKVKEMGKSIDDLAAFQEAKKAIWPWSVAHADIKVIGDNRILDTMLICHVGEYWKKVNAGELGKIYCDSDFATCAAYNPKLKFIRHKFIPAGDPYCENVWVRKEKEEE